MQSVFWPSSGISQRYDIKGCLGGRFEDPDKYPHEVVLKDQNFYHVPLNIGNKKVW